MAIALEQEKSLEDYNKKAKEIKNQIEKWEQKSIDTFTEGIQPIAEQTEVLAKRILETILEDKVGFCISIVSIQGAIVRTLFKNTGKVIAKKAIQETQVATDAENTISKEKKIEMYLQSLKENQKL